MAHEFPETRRSETITGGKRVPDRRFPETERAEAGLRRGISKRGRYDTCCGNPGYYSTFPVFSSSVASRFDRGSILFGILGNSFIWPDRSNSSRGCSRQELGLVYEKEGKVARVLTARGGKICAVTPCSNVSTIIRAAALKRRTLLVFCSELERSRAIGLIAGKATDLLWKIYSVIDAKPATNRPMNREKESWKAWIEFQEIIRVLEEKSRSPAIKAIISNAEFSIKGHLSREIFSRLNPFAMNFYVSRFT